jgi:HSP20 family molecular chaperone IbpA
MSTSEKSNIIKKHEGILELLPGRLRMDDIFENFRRDMESMFSPLWPHPITDWRIPFALDIDREARMPLYDMVDKGDKYEIQLEVLHRKQSNLSIQNQRTDCQIFSFRCDLICQ